jgi:hypothetical protein
MANSKISALTPATTPVAGTEVLPIVQSGVTKQVSIANLTAGRSVSASDYVMSTGNLVPSTAGKGVNFTANTPTSGMTSQLLDWYEAGTWVPTITASSGTLTTTAVTGAVYTRIGRQVTVKANIEVVDKGTASGFLLFSLPFTALDDFYVGVVVELKSAGLTGGCYTQSTVGVIYKYDWTGVVISNGYRWSVTLTYFV